MLKRIFAIIALAALAGCSMTSAQKGQVVSGTLATLNCLNTQMAAPTAACIQQNTDKAGVLNSTNLGMCLAVAQTNANLACAHNVVIPGA